MRKSDPLRAVRRLQIPKDREPGGDSTLVADMSANANALLGAEGSGDAGASALILPVTRCKMTL
jgi:hypothetical protein